jgi:prophage tail gpP-like protein
VSWSIRLNSVKFDSWISFSFTRDIEGNVGKFTVEASDKSPIESPLQANDKLEIYYNNQVTFTGFVDVISITGSREGSFISYEGRDKLADVVDSSLPDQAKTRKGDITLKSIIESVFSSLKVNITVIDKTKDKVGDTKVKLQKTGASGSKAMDYLSKLAASLQVWLISDEQGNINIFRAGEEKSDMKMLFLLKGQGYNNIIDASLKIDLSNIYSKIKIRGKGSLVFDINQGSVDETVDINGSSFEGWARPTRYLELKTEEIRTKQQAEQRAKDEVNLRRAKAFMYNVATNIFTDTKGIIFKLGQVMEIQDEQRQVYGRYVIGSFNVRFDRQSGTSVSLDFAPPEAYQIVDIDERQAKIPKGKEHIKQQPKSEIE